MRKHQYRGSGGWKKRVNCQTFNLRPFTVKRGFTQSLMEDSYPGKEDGLVNNMDLLVMT